VREMFPGGSEDEEVGCAHEGTDIGELDYCYKAGAGKHSWRGTIKRPRSLLIIGLLRVNKRAQEPEEAKNGLIVRKDRVIDIWKRRMVDHQGQLITPGAVKSVE